MRYNLPAIREKLPAVGSALSGAEVGAAEEAISAIESLIRDLRVPVGIADLNVADDQLRSLAKESLLVGAVKTNPRRLREQDVIAVLQEASSA
jgi:alcohol dehydrogenase class IV